MAWYRVAYRPEVMSDLNKVDKATAQRLFEKTKWLASNVDNLRHEALDLTLPDLAQYAVGEWRILYSVDRKDHVLDIHMIGKQQSLYRPPQKQD